MAGFLTFLVLFVLGTPSLVARTSPASPRFRPVPVPFETGNISLILKHVRNSHRLLHSETILRFISKSSLGRRPKLWTLSLSEQEFGESAASLELKNHVFERFRSSSNIIERISLISVGSVSVAMKPNKVHLRMTPIDQLEHLARLRNS